MLWRFRPVALLALLVLGAFTFLFYIEPVRASGTVYIRADGSVDPPNAPISTLDNVTYTLTGNITSDFDGIVIEKDNIVLNGAGYTVTGSGSGNGTTLTHRRNVTLRSMTIENFTYGICLASSSNCVLSGNNVMANNGYGIRLDSSSNNTLSGNNFMSNYNEGIALYSSDNNNLSGNNVANNGEGILLDSSSGNTLSDNNVTNNWSSIYLKSSSNNTLSGNNVANGEEGIELESSSGNILSGNNVTANEQAGIRLDSSPNNALSKNRILNNNYGIWLYSSSDNTLSGNNITANNEYGIRLGSSPNCILADNNVTSNYGRGISLISSSNNTLLGNAMGGNLYSFDVEGSALSDFLQSIDASNLVEGKPVYYFVNQSDIVANAEACPETGYLAFVDCANVTAQGLNLTNNYQGLLLAYTNDSKIVGNTVVANALGIYLTSSFGNTLSGNNATANNGDGIVLEYSSSNTLSGNIVTANGEYGIMLESSSGNILSGNNVANNWAGIYLESSSGNILSGNTATANNQYGIYLYYSSSSNTLSGNTVTSNTYDGIVLGYSSSSNTLSGNNITANNEYGVKLDFASDNTLSGNNIANNGVGIRLGYSSSNSIYHNDFINNTLQVNSDGYSNTWDNGYPSGGNYWSNYDGTDVYGGPLQNEAGSDGIGDIPRPISENNLDGYPLMSPYTGPLFYTLTISSSVGGTTDPVVGEYHYNPSAPVGITATPNKGYIFKCWLLDCEEHYENPMSLLMDSDHILTAVFADITPLRITAITQNPPRDGVTPSDVVTVNASVVPLASEVRRVFLSYNSGGGLTVVNMTLVAGSEWTATIPAFPRGTNVTYTITAEDSAGNNITSENLGYTLNYVVVPEFVLPLLIVCFAAATGLVVITKNGKNRRRVARPT